MNSNQIRKKYLDFMKQKGHAVIPSASLIPENDPTTLFTGSGMQPMVPYLLGQKHPLGTRIADSQKSFRTVELDEDTVGDNRHTTFFEMLGNWSLGDYFKKEQISWMFEFLTQILKLDPKRIFVTVYRGNKEIGIPKDKESVRYWQEEFEKVAIKAKDVDMAEEKGMRGGRIFYYNEQENWWSRAGIPQNMPIGEPGGPDSEMFWDFGEDLKIHENSIYKDQPCHPACSCGRFLEIGNNVFMQYKKTKKGFEELPQKNIDFGGGLERMAAAKLDNPDIFLTDLFDLQREVLEKMTQKQYGKDFEETKNFRIIMDHLRAAVFLISDGALPSNKDQGYFTRRLIRRSVRYANKINLKQEFTKELGRAVIKTYKNHYKDLEKNKKKILKELIKEEKKFRKTLEKGLKKFNKIVRKEQIDNSKINGKVAFDLYQTYGFPIEMTVEMARENDMDVDMEGFKKEQKKHQELSRQGAQKKFKGGLADAKEKTVKLHTAAHLVLAALREILEKGQQVYQKGSNITADRLRFDFSFDRKLTEQEVEKVEAFVNQAIKEGIEVKMKEMSLQKAKEIGAQGVFDSKYGEKVKVYTIKGYSQEICGGPHVKNTSELGKFKIIKQESVGSGIRRIKAVLE
ncbi:MAG: alanine--tRNA ligase [Candidatus Moranbacteria bacterium]|nr:alanine--tRNA ligase [Candidatus Moranbacteria bacterium]